MKKLLIISALFSALLVWSPLQNIFPFSWLYLGFSYLSIFFHELGHAVFGLIYGYPSFPSFDPVYGGGMTYHFGRLIPIQFLVLAACAYFCFFIYSKDHRIFWLGVVLSVLLTISSLSEFHHVIMAFMGHGAEAIMGGVLLFKVLFNLTKDRSLEREAHAVIGFFMSFNLIDLCWKLIHDDAFQDQYFQQKGAERFGDFSKIADHLGHVNENTGAWFCIFCAIICLITPFISYWYVHKDDVYEE